MKVTDLVFDLPVYRSLRLDTGISRSLFPDLLSDRAKWSEVLDVDSEGHRMFEDFLSGLEYFYGLLWPFDGVTPYRLEMQAKLVVDGCRDLYQFWGSCLARQLASETDVVLNLASKEYSKAVEAYLPKTVRFVTCAFGELKDGKVVEKGTKCKMARGQMVRWLAENQIKNLEDLQVFDHLGYQFCRSASVENHTVFLWIQSPKD